MIQRLALENIVNSLGWDHWGTAALERPLTFDYYLQWIGEHLHGNMEYLSRHIPMKENPQALDSRAHSAIVVARSYAPAHPYPLEDAPLKNDRLARYARGGDYHHGFKDELSELCRKLQEVYPEESFLPFTDSAPVLERDLAYRAGLGWVGKNTCLIDRKKGSLFFIGEIYTSLNLESQPLEVKDFCGNCRRCIDACPTGALIDERRMDARKCISYLTIESSEIPEQPLRQQIGDWLFGCDICQEVCPWNKKVLAQESKIVSQTQTETLIEELRWILSSSNKSLQKTLKNTPLSRSAGFKLKRNALIVIGNQGLEELRSEVEHLSLDERLGELATWCLSNLNAKSLRKNI